MIYLSKIIPNEFESFEMYIYCKFRKETVCVAKI